MIFGRDGGEIAFGGNLGTGCYRSPQRGLNRRLALPPEAFRCFDARLVRMAVRRRNDAEIRNAQPGRFTRSVSGFVPGNRKPKARSD